MIGKVFVISQENRRDENLEQEKEIKQYDRPE